MLPIVEPENIVSQILGQGFEAAPHIGLLSLAASHFYRFVIKNGFESYTRLSKFIGYTNFDAVMALTKRGIICLKKSWQSLYDQGDSIYVFQNERAISNSFIIEYQVKTRYSNSLNVLNQKSITQSLPQLSPFRLPSVFTRSQWRHCLQAFGRIFQ